MKGFRVKVELLLPWARRRGPRKGADFEPFSQDTHAGAIKVESFEAVTPFVGKEEQGSVFERVWLELISNRSQAVERFAHIAWLDSEEDT